MTRRLILQKAHRHLPRSRERFRLRLLVGTRVQVFSLPARGAFHLSLSVLFLYRSPAVFSLGPWSALFQPEFHVLRPTRVPRTGSLPAFAYGAFTLCGMLSQYISTSGSVCHSPSGLRTAPSCTHNPTSATTAVLALTWFGLFPFRSPLLGESLRFLFLGLLRCFTSPGSSLIRGRLDCSSRVAPFGHLRIKDRLRLPGAFRSLPRPSSAAGAKASTVCPLYLFLTFFGCSFLYSAVKVRREYL